MNKDIQDKIKNAKLTPEQQSLFKQVKRQAGSFKGKSEQEIFNQVEQMARAQKKAGTIDNKTLDEFASKIAPALNAQQRAKMNQILARLKKQ